MIAGKRILLVEDDPHIRLLVGSILRQKGYLTVDAENGLQALDRLRDQPDFDLIITDLQMPGLSGTALLHKLCQSHPEIPVIIISAFTQADWPADTHERTVVSLPKPFSHAQLVSVVAAIA